MTYGLSYTYIWRKFSQKFGEIPRISTHIISPETRVHAELLATDSKGLPLLVFTQLLFSKDVDCSQVVSPQQRTFDHEQLFAPHMLLMISYDTCLQTLNASQDWKALRGWVLLSTENANQNPEPYGMLLSAKSLYWCPFNSPNFNTPNSNYRVRVRVRDRVRVRVRDRVRVRVRVRL